jgi:hypothetical protein
MRSSHGLVRGGAPYRCAEARVRSEVAVAHLVRITA